MKPMLALFALGFCLGAAPSVSMAEIVIFPTSFEMGSLSASLTRPKEVAARLATRTGARLAAQEKLPLAEAHFVMAQRIAHSKNVSSRAWEIVCHLEAALAGGHQGDACRTALGQIQLVAGNFDQAVRYLKPVCENRPDLRLAMARALLALHRPSEARIQAEQARHELHQAMQQQPAGSAEELRWLACLEFLEQYEIAVEFLKRRLADENSDDRFSQALSQLYVSWFDHLARSQPHVDRAAIAKLQHALQATPRHRPSIERLIVIARPAETRPAETSDSTSPPQAKETSERTSNREGALAALRSGNFSSHVHLVLGSVLFEAGDVDEGVWHSQRAYAKNPRSPAALNNLAWMLAHQTPPRLDRARDLADKLVADFPRQIEFRETRGQIHALRKEWSQALVDLQLAEKVMPEHPGLHRTLTQVFQALGRPAEAETHQKILDRLGQTAGP